MIQLATWARNRERGRFKCGRYGDSTIVEGIFNDDLLNHDVVICGTHRMRHQINRQIRRLLGFRGTTPEVGEKVICLKNCRYKGLRNGTIWSVTKSKLLKDGFVAMTVQDEVGTEVDVIAPDTGFTSVDGNGADLPMQPFAFGYCITCHKAQGSQWDEVMVIDESRVFGFGWNRWRWLYTAITRAAHRVTIARV